MKRCSKNWVPQLRHEKMSQQHPKVLFEELPDYPHLILAKAYAENGQIEKSLEHVREMPTTRASSLRVGAYPLIEILKKDGHEVAAREVLVRWAQCLANADSIF